MVALNPAYTPCKSTYAGRITREFIAPIPQSFDLPTNTVTYDKNNRIATFKGLNVRHDVDGNMTSGPLTGNTLETHVYDARNRLSSVGGISYQYDAENNRIGQADTSGTTNYAIDPNSGLSKVLVRTRPDGSQTFYVYGMGLQYEVDESENTLTYHYDYRGSTRMLTADDGQTVTDQIEYTPYGVITYRTGSTDTPFLYNGMFGVMTDANGLLQMRARYYNPFLKRFINQDPIGFDGGMNWYVYAGGNPISKVDPSGNVPLIAVPIVIGGYFLGTTQTANAPGPGDITTNDTPLFEPVMSVAGGGIGGKAIVTGSKALANQVAKTTVTQGVAKTANIGAINTGVLSIEQATMAGAAGANAFARATASTALNTSQNLGAFAVRNYSRFAQGSFLVGFGVGASTPLEPSDTDRSMNPFFLPFQAGKLLGGIATSNVPTFNNSFNSSSSGLK